jgi:hypothetical protein
MTLHDAVGHFLSLIVGMPTSQAIAPLAADYTSKSYREVYDHALLAINGIDYDKARAMPSDVRHQLMEYMRRFKDEQSLQLLSMSDSSKGRRSNISQQPTELNHRPLPATTG